jgi:pimeloyl-ACP methyl ester carboxylesterase
MLKGRQDIQRSRIGLIGHSEGAVVGAIAAARSRDVAYVVMLAGMGLTGEEVVVGQSAAMQRKLGVSAPVIDATRSTLKRVFAVLRTEPDDTVAIARMQEVLDSEAATLPSAVRQEFEPVMKTVTAQLRMYTSAWFRYFIDYDPVRHLRRVKVPLLAVTGELDLQALPQENLSRIEKAVRGAGNRRVTVREMPGLNHLFQTASTGLPGEYATIEETIAPEVLKVVAGWIRQLQ